jgi:hypothetical protein
MMAPDETVPDLLRRFTPTPYHLNLLMAGVSLSLQTNDSDLLAHMRNAAQAWNSELNPLFLLKLIRDYDVVTDAMDITMLSAGPLVTITVGSRSIIVLDCERHEILGFLSASITPAMFINELLPLLLHHMLAQN